MESTGLDALGLENSPDPMFLHAGKAERYGAVGAECSRRGDEASSDLDRLERLLGPQRRMRGEEGDDDVVS